MNSQTENIFKKMISEAEKTEAKKQLEFEYAAERYSKAKAVHESSKEKTAALNLAFEEFKKNEGAE